MHTNEETRLTALIKAQTEIDEFTNDLKKNGLPQDWDAVVFSEWLGYMAHDIASDSACLRSRSPGSDTYSKIGIDSCAGYLASFWETHHLLSHVMGDYSKGVAAYFNHASEMLAQAVADNSPTPSPKAPSKVSADAVAEEAFQSAFAVLCEHADPDDEHDLGTYFDTVTDHNDDYLAEDLKASFKKAFIDAQAYVLNASSNK